MPKPTTESHLALLRQLRSAPSAPQTLPALTELLGTKNLHGIVLKTAAELAQKIDAKSLAPELVAHITTLIQPGQTKRDPGCFGKTAALHALIDWDASAAIVSNLYLAAARYSQHEPVMKGTVDTAAEFRGLAALGLALARPDNALLVLIDLLADPEKQTRQHAAIALGAWPGAEALPALRLKAHLGDEDPDTLAEVLAALLRQDPAGHLPFVANFLHDKNPQIAEAAALALGQSKLPAALAPLIAAYPAFRLSPTATTLLMAISLLRTDAALDWLLAQLSSARTKEAAQILDALALHKADPKLLARLQTLLDQSPHLRPAFQEAFR
jgi:HEAT repeat protein